MKLRMEEGDNEGRGYFLTLLGEASEPKPDQE